MKICVFSLCIFKDDSIAVLRFNYHKTSIHKSTARHPARRNALLTPQDLGTTILSSSQFQINLQHRRKMPVLGGFRAALHLPMIVEYTNALTGYHTAVRRSCARSDRC
jgi:hypothetical protein